MKGKIAAHVDEVLKQIDGSREEKNDLHAELTDHLQLTYEAALQAGLSEEEAIEKTFEDFGDAKTVGAEIQAAMYPFRKMLLSALAVASLGYVYAAYLYELFVHGEAAFMWLLLGVTTSSLLLMIALQVFPTFDRKVNINTILIVHALIFLVATGLEELLAIVAWVIVGGAVGLIYRTTIIDYNFKQTKYQQQLKRCHIYNITVGLFIVGMTLFLLGTLLLFSGGFLIGMLFFLVPLIVWIVAYRIQVTLINRGQRAGAMFIGLLPLVMVILGIMFYFYDFLIRGL